MRARYLDSIAEIDEAAWDQLVPDGNPFVSHGFLRALEASGSASSRTGWQPLHLVVEDGGCAVAAAPLYVKGHSYGEYVFDHGWANAFERAGGRYYPKLQVAVPFTPVPGPRLLAADPDARAVLARCLRQMLETLGLSSLHVTFCAEADRTPLATAGFLERRGVQYHWANAGYGCFADFLDSLRSAKKKMVRKEREQVRAAGVLIETLYGDGLDPERLAEFYPFYLATVDKRWGNAYLTRDFFRRLGTDLRHQVILVTARHAGRMVAGALNILGPDALYGRLWGCLEDFRFLHFEACYYAAIEFAIDRGLARVEAGAQGQHKLARGYAPVPTYSAHLITNPSLRAAVERFLDAETGELEAEMGDLESLLPYRRG